MHLVDTAKCHSVDKCINVGKTTKKCSFSQWLVSLQETVGKIFQLDILTSTDKIF